MRHYSNENTTPNTLFNAYKPKLIPTATVMTKQRNNPLDSSST
jgi:hypothetical protein